MIIFSVGLLVSGGNWIVGEVRTSAQQAAEIQYMQKYESVITDNIILRATCDGVVDTAGKPVKHK